LLKDLDELDISVEAGDVIADLRTLLTLASAARTAEEEKVYTIEDSGVIPPRPLGRQLSAASMSRMSLRPTGHLEILVGRSRPERAVLPGLGEGGEADPPVVRAHADTNKPLSLEGGQHTTEISGVEIEPAAEGTDFGALGSNFP